MLETVALGNVDFCGSTELSEEGFDQGCFADPWLAREEDQLAAALLCLSEEVMQSGKFGLSSNKIQDTGAGPVPTSILTA